MIKKLYSSSNLMVIPENLIDKAIIFSPYIREDYWGCKVSALIINVRGFRKLLKMLNDSTARFIRNQEGKVAPLEFPMVLELWEHSKGGMEDFSISYATRAKDMFEQAFNNLSLNEEFRIRIDLEFARKERQINNKKALLVDRVKQLENILYKEVPLLLRGVAENKAIEVSDRGGVYDEQFETATTPAWDFYNYKYRIGNG